MQQEKRGNDTVVGFLESVGETLTAQGWARSRDSDEPVELSIAVDGVIVASAMTDVVRPDLITQGISSGPAGFNIAIPPSAIRRLRSWIHILHNDTPISDGLPLDLTRNVSISLHGIEYGQLRVKVRGWPGRAIKAAVKIDGVARGALKIPAGNRYLAAEAVDISWPVPQEFCDGRAHVYAVELDHEEAVVRSDLSVIRHPDFRIFIDTAAFNGINGWVFERDRASPVSITAWCQGRKIGSAVAELRRQDVAGSLSLDTDRVGFSIEFYERLTGPYAEIALREAETGLLLTTVSVISPYEQMISIAAAHRGAPGQSYLPTAVLAGAINKTSGEIQFINREEYFHDLDCPAGEVAVIVPVYGGALELAECMDSLLRAKNNTPHLLVLVNDATPEPVIRDYLRSLEARAIPNLRIVHRTANCGFSAAVNVGMIIAGKRDVVLLNADTVVCDHWLDNLAAAAAQDERIGTVTPFSNNGEIATVPYICKSIPVESIRTAEAVNEAAGRLNRGKLVDLPVAIGFCMMIRHRCLEDIGLFDAEKWGRGYGEEVDFCLKAAARGWRHVLTGDTFMIHRGAVSFGDDKLHRIIEAGRKISETYPFYDRIIQHFLKNDPVAALRRPINLALIARTLGERKVLHVTHALGGGTERYIADMAELYEGDGRSNIILRFARSGAASLELNPGQAFGHFFQKIHREEYRSSESDQLIDDLAVLGIGTVHLHSPIGIPPAVLARIIENRALTVTIHDYAWATPSVTFTTPSGAYFGDDADNAAAVAASFSHPYPGLEPWTEQAGNDINAYRKMFDAILLRADHVMCGARDVAARMKALGFTARFTAMPHPLPESSPHAGITPFAAPLQVGETIRVALLGGISEIKGFSQLLACARYASQNNLPIRFQVFGYTENDALLQTLPNVSILGRYQDADIARMLKKHRPHISFFPNTGPETFSYTLTAAMKAGLWPVVSDIGATAERVKESGYGSVYSRSLTPDLICKVILDAAYAKERTSRTHTENQPAELSEYLASSLSV